MKRNGSELNSESAEPGGMPPVEAELVKHAGAGLYRLDAGGRVVHANSALARLLRHSSVTDLFSARGDFRAGLYVSPDHADRLASHLERHGRVEGLEAEILCADKAHAWVSETVVVLRDANGRKKGEAGTLIDINEHHGTREALDHSEERCRALAEHSQDGVFVAQDARLLYVNSICAHMLGYEPGEMVGEETERFFAPSERFRLAEIREARETGRREDVYYETRLLMKDGETTVPVTIHSGAIRHLGKSASIGTVRNLAAEHRSRRRLEAAETRYRNIVEHAAVGIYQSTPAGELLSANPALLRMLGYVSLAELKAEVGTLEALYALPGQRESRLVRLDAGGSLHDEELCLRRRGGGEIWLSETARAVRDAAGALRYYEGMLVDISSRKAMEEELRYRANHDALTGLPNRRLFRERLDAALKEARSAGVTDHAVLFIALDAVGWVNNSLGHPQGDRLLREAAARLQHVTAPGDIVCSYGGGEFAMLVQGVGDAEAASTLAERVEAAFEEPFRLAGYEINAHLHVGVVLCEPERVNAETVLRDADAAMAAGKRLGRTGQLFDDSIRRAALERLELESAVRTGLARGEFEMHYQPICDMSAGRVVAFEALLRWRHPERGLLAPESFLSVAEETGLILDIGWQGLDTVLGDCAAWQAPGRRIPVAFNLSNRQFHMDGLAAKIAAALATSGLAASLLNIEVTEEVFLRDTLRARHVFERLQALGVRLHLDDFGTGYSGLAWLSELPFDALKIDRSFVRELPHDERKHSIVKNIVALAHDLGLVVIAEGVEREEEAATLRELGCIFAQGYFYGAAMNSEAALARLHAEQ